MHAALKGFSDTTQNPRFAEYAEKLAGCLVWMGQFFFCFFEAALHRQLGARRKLKTVNGLVEKITARLDEVCTLTRLNLTWCFSIYIFQQIRALVIRKELESGGRNKGEEGQTSRTEAKESLKDLLNWKQ